MMEVNNFASKGVAGTALGLGAASLGLNLLNGNIGGLLGGVTGNCGCSEDHYVNRYELKLEQESSAKDSKIALLESSIYVDGKLNEFRNYVDGRFSGIEQQICAQNVYNATNTAAIGCINGQIAQLMSLTQISVPATKVCPQPMPLYNSWAAPSTPTTTTAG